MLWQLACLCLFVPPTCDYSDGLHWPYSVSSVRGREPLTLEVSNLCSSKWWAWGGGRHLYSKDEDQRSADPPEAAGDGLGSSGYCWVSSGWQCGHQKEISVFVFFPLAMETRPSAILIPLTIDGQSCLGCILRDGVEGI